MHTPDATTHVEPTLWIADTPQRVCPPRGASALNLIDETPTPHAMHSPRSSHPLLLLLTILLLACTLSCTSTTKAPEDGEKPKAEAEEPSVSETSLNAFAAHVAAQPHGYVQRSALHDKILAEVQKQAKKKVSSKKDPYTYRSILRRIYVRDEGAPHRLYFVHGKGLSWLGARLIEHFKEMEFHGIDPEDLHLPKIQRNQELLHENLTENGPLSDDFTLSDPQKQALVALLKDNRVDPSKEKDLDARLIELLSSPKGASVIPDFAGKSSAVREPTKKELDRLARIELYIADALAKYAWVMQYKNRYRYDQDLFKKKDRKQREAVMAGFLRDDMPTKLKQPVPELFAWLDDIIPKNDEYQKLLPHLKRYMQYAKAGGWSKTTPVPGLRKGVRHETVPKLKERLAAEGYYPPNDKPLPKTLTDEYDADLELAVRNYQETHQMDVTGAPHRTFWRSIDVPVKKRLDYLKITIDRWRESAPRKDYYVYINIPDFHAEVWKDGKRIYRMRIIVGNREFGCNLSTKRWERLNSTPRQIAEISHIVVNPYWNIPERILREEVLPMSRKDVNFWEDSGYECLRRKDGECTKARQAGGADNALGGVKIIFPNKYNTYMHDTPKKHPFTFPVRALSHGCMRMHKPFEMAQLLLEQDGQWDEDDWNNRREEKKESVIVLEKKVPIYIEYYTNRVDDQGRLHFLADIYKYDRYRHRGRPFDARRCRPDELANARNPGDNGLD